MSLGFCESEFGLLRKWVWTFAKVGLDFWGVVNGDRDGCCWDRGLARCIKHFPEMFT